MHLGRLKENWNESGVETRCRIGREYMFRHTALMTYALITGASSGIGEATARLLAGKGRNLIVLARRGDRLKKLQTDLLQQKIEVRIHACDVTDHKALEKLFSGWSDVSIDLVVNNAGLALGVGPFDEQDFADIAHMVEVNILGMMKVAHLSLPFLKKTKGHLINLGSIAGKETYAGGTVYCGTKHFVHAFTQGLRKDLLGSGVRVTTVAPGKVQTEFSLVRLKGDAKKASAVYAEYTPLGAKDIAEAIWHAVSSPAHVDLEEILVMPTDQAGISTAKH